MDMLCSAVRGPCTCFAPAYLLNFFSSAYLLNFFQVPSHPLWQVPCLSKLLEGELSKLLLYNLTLHGLL